MNYIFLAIPNFCGSTVMHSLLETSPTVAKLKSRSDFIEGNCIANTGYYIWSMGPHSIEANMEHVHSDPQFYNWPLIKKIWHESWANENPYAQVLLQKTPGDIFRLKQMLPHFPGSKWIVSVREPYSYVESIMRKQTFMMDPIFQLDQICYHVGRVMELQIENLNLLGDNGYSMTLEDFSSRPKYHVAKILQWMPELQSLNLQADLTIKGVKNEHVKETDLDKRIDRLKTYHPDIINIINSHLYRFSDSISYWGYSLRS